MDQQKVASEFVPLNRIFSTSNACRQSEEFAECLQNSPASRWVLSPARRLAEICFALAALLVFSAPMLIVAFCIRLTSNGPAFFSQERMGRHGRLFRIYKFRSMTESCGKKHGPGLTQAGDNRVTPLGRLIRKLKIDELPQFYNVLRGEMSLVGPRPKLPKYVAMFNMNYRPGITGPATIAFRHEEELMRPVDPSQLDAFYAENIKPLKARLDACYMCRATPASDLQILLATFLGWIRPSGAPKAMVPALNKRPSSVRIYGVSQEEAAGGFES
jgi:lipopolysaccharide/colanic/teichoic acid biosynthesis glycosyltransferase